jgi:hypothetical protein
VFLGLPTCLEVKQKPDSVKQQLVFVLAQKLINPTLRQGTIASFVLIVNTKHTLDLHGIEISL